MTFTDYGDDSTCSTDTNDTTIYSYNSSIPDGEAYQFNCNGEVNYVITDGCNAEEGQGDEWTCCDSPNCVPTITATNVCVRNPGGSYRMYVYTFIP